MDVLARSGRSATRASLLVAAVAAVAATVTASVLTLPAAGAPAPVDPAALPRGADPAVVHLVRDTIRDGDRRIPATKRGEHERRVVARSAAGSR